MYVIIDVRSSFLSFGLSVCCGFFMSPSLYLVCIYFLSVLSLFMYFVRYLFL